MSDQLITASALPRLFACTASGVYLPGAVDKLIELAGSTVSERGRKAHEDIEADAELGQLDEAVAKFIPDGSKHEMAFAYNVATGEAVPLPNAVGRAYWAAVQESHPTWLAGDVIAGRADVIGVDKSRGEGTDRMVVIDWKTGRNVGAPGSNAQLLFYAMCAARAYGTDEALVRVVYLRGETAYPSDADVGFFDLEAYEAKLRAVVSMVRAGEAVEKAGDHCRYCPVKTNCKTFGAIELAAKSMPVGAEIVVTPDTRALAAASLEMMESYVRRLKEALHRDVYSNGPIPMADGRVLTLHRAKPREKIDALAALPLLTSRGLLDAIDYSTSKTAISRALKAQKPVGGVAAAERAVIGELRNIGAVTLAAGSETLKFMGAAASELTEGNDNE